VALRLKVAQRLGILSCRGSRMAVLPAALDDKLPALEGVQVRASCKLVRALQWHSSIWKALPAPCLNTSRSGSCLT
jgi:hypothetical protein